MDKHDDTDMTEAEFDAVWAEAEPVELVAERPSAVPVLPGVGIYVLASMKSWATGEAELLPVDTRPALLSTAVRPNDPTHLIPA